MIRTASSPRSALAKVRESPSSTKARILAPAQAVFAARGFKGASTREIAAAAGVNISSLHDHWESKGTLYFAVLLGGNLVDPQVRGRLRAHLVALVHTLLRVEKARSRK